MTKTFIFGKPYSSVKLRNIQASCLDDAIEEFKITELYPELYVAQEFVTRREEMPYPYDPVVTISTDAVIEVSEIEGGERLLRSTLPVHDVNNATLSRTQHSLTASQQKLDSALAKGEDNTPLLTKQDARLKMDALTAKKLSLEKQMKEVESQMQVLEQSLQNAAKTLRLMKNYAGVDAELVQICNGAPADEETPLTVYQQKLYMDENVGILRLFEGGTDSLDINNLEEFDNWIATRYKTFMPAEKAFTVWQIRREAKRYALGCDKEADLFNLVMNKDNFQTYFLIRNGERLWRFTSDFRVPDEVFPKRNEKNDRFSLSREMQDTEKRLYALAALQGLIDHTDILGTRLREKGINLLSPVLDESNIIFVRNAEPDQFITDGHPRWSDWLRANQNGISKGSRIMPVVSHQDITSDCGCGERWNVIRSTNNRCAVYSIPDDGEIYTVEDIDSSYWGADGIKILFNPRDEVYRYRGDWVSNHERMVRIGFRYFRDEVIDIDAVSFEDISYYLSSSLDRADYITMLPLLARLYNWKRKEREEETPFAMLLASKAGLNWDKDEERIRSVIHWWKTKNRIRRAVTSDDKLAFRMCLKELEEENR